MCCRVAVEPGPQRGNKTNTSGGMSRTLLNRAGISSCRMGNADD